MADRVHHALALDDQRHVEVGDQDAFAGGERRNDVLALGRDDGGHAAAADSVARPFLGRNLGDLVFGEPTGGVDDEAAALERVMADRHLDLVGEDLADQRARELGDVNLFVLGHQRIAGEGIVMFPASQRANPPDRGVDHLETGAIALTPDHALMKCRCDLAALQNQRAVGVEDQLRVVERAVVTLIDAEHDHDVVFAGRGGHRLGDRAGNDDRVVIEVNVLGAARASADG